MSLRKEELRVRVNDEIVVHSVYVDSETGLDVDEATGSFRTREESLALIQDVYTIGRASCESDLDRYNRWIRATKSEQVGIQKTSLISSSSSDTVASTEVPRYLELRNEGNECFLKKEFRKALRSYEHSFLLCNAAANGSSLLNLVECELRLKRFWGARSTSGLALTLQPQAKKATYRKILSLCACGDRRQANQLLTRSEFDEQDTVALSALLAIKDDSAFCWNVHGETRSLANFEVGEICGVFHPVVRLVSPQLTLDCLLHSCHAAFKSKDPAFESFLRRAFTRIPFPLGEVLPSHEQNFDQLKEAISIMYKFRWLTFGNDDRSVYFGMNMLLDSSKKTNCVLKCSAGTISIVVTERIEIGDRIHGVFSD